MLEGTQPDDALRIPSGPPHALSRPAIALNAQGGQLKFGFTWPDGLMGRFQFGLDASAQVGGPYQSIGTPVIVPLGANRYEIQAPTGNNPVQFYRLTVRLAE
jgi:hypothetical protein